MIVEGYSLPKVSVEGVNLQLYPHQAALYCGWDTCDSFVITTKTGSGKTAAALLPVIKRRQNAVFVYPTNELIFDQQNSIARLMEVEGVSFIQVSPDNYGKAHTEEYELLRIDSRILEAFRLKLDKKTKGEALNRLLHDDKRRIVLINPDILYLLYAMRFRESAEVISHFYVYETIVFDEFHLYSGIELAHILFLIFFARKLGAFRKTLILTATLHAAVAEKLAMLVSPHIINTDVTGGLLLSEKQQMVCHSVKLETIYKEGLSVTEAIVPKILELKPTLEQLRNQHISGKYVPCVIIVNSVIEAIRLEDALVEQGIERQNIEPMRGLLDRQVRGGLQNKWLVIGTSAIEVGVDFDCDYLIFEAGNAVSFLQRFGRVGRHKPGTAFLVADSLEAERIINTDRMSRDQFQAHIMANYKNPDNYAWFVQTQTGIFTAIAQLELVKMKVDTSPDEAATQQIEMKLDAFAEEYGNLLNDRQKLKIARSWLKRKKQWVRDYLQNLSFRMSVPSLDVIDFAEKDRGRGAEYSADLFTLLRRANIKSYITDNKDIKVYVYGYGTYRDIWINRDFTNEADAYLSSTGEADYDDIAIIREEGRTPLSPILVEPKSHVFCVVENKQVQDFLDWQLPTIKCGRYGIKIMAIDGGALLLYEIYQRQIYRK